MRETTKKRKKKRAFGVIKKILNVLGVILILLLMALCVFLIYQRVTGQEPKLFGYRLFEVQTGSMEPTIMTGDTILTKEYGKNEEIQIGDIVVFKNDQIWTNVGKPELKGNYIVHRVIYIDRAEGYIITLGDNNHGISDPQTDISAVEAKYVTRFSGGFFRFIRSPFGIVAIVAALVAIFAAMRLIYALNAKRKQKQIIESGDASADGTSEETVTETIESKETEISIKEESLEDSEPDSEENAERNVEISEGDPKRSETLKKKKRFLEKTVKGNAKEENAEAVNTEEKSEENREEK